MKGSPIVKVHRNLLQRIAAYLQADLKRQAVEPKSYTAAEQLDLDMVRIYLENEVFTA
jgi:hypothetical protein